MWSCFFIFKKKTKKQKIFINHRQFEPKWFLFSREHPFFFFFTHARNNTCRLKRKREHRFIKHQTTRGGQTIDEVTVIAALPEGTRGRNLTVEMKPKSLFVSLNTTKPPKVLLLSLALFSCPFFSLLSPTENRSC